MKPMWAMAALLVLGACAQGGAPGKLSDASRQIKLSLPSMPREDSYESYRWALETDNLASLQTWVAKGLGPNLVMPDSNPALIYAMVNGSAQTVEWLLKHPQLDVNQTNGRGDTALMTASGLGELKWVETLIKRGGRVNPAAGWTALHYAAASNRLSVIERLLKASAHVNAISANGTTPLMMAARANAFESVSLLLKQGAVANLENDAGFSALGYAKRNGNVEMEMLIRKYLAKTRSTD